MAIAGVDEANKLLQKISTEKAEGVIKIFQAKMNWILDNDKKPPYYKDLEVAALWEAFNAGHIYTGGNS